MLEDGECPTCPVSYPALFPSGNEIVILMVFVNMVVGGPSSKRQIMKCRGHLDSFLGKIVANEQ